MFSHMIPIALTPFSNDGSLDLSSIPRLTNFYRQEHATALVVLGIMGEAHALSDWEREAVIESFVRTSGNLPIIATVSAPSTEVACDRARRARALGATSIMVAPPPAVTDPHTLTEHFSRVAQAADLPWVLQDEPITTGVRLSLDTVQRLVNAIPTLAAIKIEDVPTPSKIAALAKVLPEIALFGGLGGLYLFEELNHGARGSMTGFSFPHILNAIIRKFLAGNLNEARQHFYRYLPLIRYEAQLGVKGIAIRKALFFNRGLIASPTVRAPAQAADAVVAADLLDLVQALGLSLSPDVSAI